MQALTEDYAAGDCVGSHCHRDGQLIHASHGVMLVSSSDGDWVIPTGHALWVPGGVAHEVRMAGLVAMRTLLVPGAPLFAHCQVLAVDALLRELILAATAPSVAADSVRQRHVVALLGVELQRASRVVLHIPLPRDRRLRSLCAAVLECPSAELSLEQGAALVNLSVRSLARGFRRELGLSFGAWRTRARMLLGEQQLLRGRPVLAVALEHGYQSPSAFAATFRRTLGYAPSDCHPA